MTTQHYFQSERLGSQHSELLKSYPNIVIHSVGNGHSQGALDKVHGEAFIEAPVNPLIPEISTMGTNLVGLKTNPLSILASRSYL